MVKQRVRFTFPQDLITQPVIHNLSHDFGIITNIRRADVRENVGWVGMELEGTEEDIERGLVWVTSIGVRVDPISGDVLEG